MEDWFESWFDTKYYHLLYSNRDYEEAEQFIDVLLSFLAPDEKSSILDLACGAGRHAIYINKAGYEVTGIDLSKNSIDLASESETDSLKFEVRDMRTHYADNKYDYIFNLFTSFGYFETKEEDMAVLSAINHGLKQNGILVIDFLNTFKVIENLVPSETKIVDNIAFNITRKIEEQRIVKSIQFTDNDQKFSFTEAVHAYVLSDFEEMLEQAGLLITAIFGSYNLDPFTTTSDRLIIIAQKQYPKITLTPL